MENNWGPEMHTQYFEIQGLKGTYKPLQIPTKNREMKASCSARCSANYRRTNLTAFNLVSKKETV
jgi:shikimate 5-dehydrogenase